jgi:hypothetical protein
MHVLVSPSFCRSSKRHRRCALDIPTPPAKSYSKAGPMDAPSQPRTPANGLVGVRNTDDALRDIEPFFELSVPTIARYSL